MNRAGLAGLTIVVFLLLTSAVAVAITPASTGAAPAATIRYVALSGSDAGSDCSVAAAPCRTIQFAVDQAQEGDEIRIAAGAYTGVSSRTGISQTVYLSKTLTLTGGFTTANWTTPDADAHPTVLNAQGEGRVLYVAGNDSVVQGLRMTGGDASGLGGIYGTDAGGGVYIAGGAPTIRNCIIITNTASSKSSGEGGGVFLNDSRALLSHNGIRDNFGSSHSTGWGGGIYAYLGEPTLTHNRVQGNLASGGSFGYGGGVYLGFTDAVLSYNRILDNSSDASSGGKGGGIFFHVSTSDLQGDIIRGNTAGHGGGVSLYGSSSHTKNELVNAVIAGNQATRAGSGVYAEAVDLHLTHTTIGGNSGSEASGVHAALFVWGDDHYPTTVELRNVILVDQTVGITVSLGCTASLDSTLWHNNLQDWAGDGAISHSRDFIGDPVFADDGYHILGESPARDAGQDAGIRVDIDGERRPMHRAVDIGADEFPARTLFLPFLRASAP